MFRFIYTLSPKRYKKWIKSYISYCNFDVSPIQLVGFFILFGIGIGFASGFLTFLIAHTSVEVMFLIWLIAFATAEFIMHILLVLIADSRSNFVETILPDALQIISANLRSGLTPDKAILTSARPEFGPLEEELKKVSKETLAGRPFDEAFRRITQKIKSRILEKTVNLLVEGLAKGGSLTTLLDSIADDIRQVRLLRGEIKSYVMMYGIFIFFAAGIGAPLLFSVSTYMVQTINTLGGQINTEALLTSSTFSFFKFRTTNITSSFLVQYSSIALLVISIFGGMLIGLVQEGSEKAGLKFVPLLIGISYAVFFISQYLLGSIFTTFIV